MATDAIIVLQNLQCISLSDASGRAPYIWPVLLWIDDNTLMTPDLVGVTGPVLGDARVVLKDDMHAGETADIPYPLGTLGVRFEDHLNIRRLILVVALLEKHDTPEAAMWAGFKAFSSELRAAVADNLFSLNDEGQRQQIIADIKMRVESSVRSAIRNALTGPQKIGVFLGTLHLDQERGSDFSYFPDATPTNIGLTLADDSSNRYAIQGGLLVRTPPIDLCQAQVDRANAAQKVVDGLNTQKSNLQAQLAHAGPAQKAGIIAQIKQCDDALPGAQADLDDANRALQACRDHFAQLFKERPRVTGITVVGT